MGGLAGQLLLYLEKMGVARARYTSDRADGRRLDLVRLVPVREQCKRPRPVGRGRVIAGKFTGTVLSFRHAKW